MKVKKTGAISGAEATREKTKNQLPRNPGKLAGGCDNNKPGIYSRVIITVSVLTTSPADTLISLTVPSAGA